MYAFMHHLLHLLKLRSKERGAELGRETIYVKDQIFTASMFLGVIWTGSSLTPINS